jgi:molybdopterin molybdotransferase
LIGLPGNPVACMLTFLIFARPALLRLAGAAVVAPQYYPVTADFSFKKRIGRREWLRGSLRRDADGHLVAHPFPHEGSGILTSMVASQGLIELPEAMAAVHPGDQVDFLPFSETLG